MSDLTPQPPPERELPPGRHGALRSQLLDEIAGREPRRAPSVIRRRLLPMVAAAAVLIVIAAVVGVVIGSHRRPAPTVDRQDKVTIEPVVPGYSHAELNSIKNACVEAAKKWNEHSVMKPLEEQVDLSSLRVYNVVIDDLGAMAVLYGTDGIGNCTWSWPPGRTTPATVADLTAKNGEGSVGPAHPQWLSGPVNENTGAFVGSPGGTSAYARIGGQVTGNVARIEVTAGGKTASAVPVNGTYLATLRFTKDPATYWPVIHAYDRTNKLLGVVDDKADRKANRCVVTPQGVRISGPKPTNGKKCTRAVPWR